MITKQEVLEFQKNWSDGIVNINNTYNNGGDFINEAETFINTLYAYDTETVLFKPTLAFKNQFRLDKQGALSYFVGGDTSFPEDEGFALKGWVLITWENAGIKFLADSVVCIGNYFFTDHNEKKLQVEYSIVLKRINGFLKLVLHDSHLPYQK